MTTLRKSSSLCSLNDIDFRDILNPKQTFTDKLCGLINYITLIPTLIYNIVWIYMLTSELNNSFNEESINNNNSGNNICSSMQTSLISIYSWCTISIVKSVSLLCCANFICGGENECNVICLVVKFFFSFIPSVYFVYLLDYTSNINNLQVESCHNIWNYVHTYYIMERIYVYFFVVLLVMLPVGTILLACKELWKSRKYHEF